MNGSSVNSRVEQVWSRLAGCFGEALARKFGDDPPPEWRSTIAEMNDYQLAQGMRRLKYSGKPHPPSLPEFVKLCRTVGHADDIPDSQPPAPHTALTDQTKWDPWLCVGNLQLLRHITTEVPKNPKRYGRGPSYMALRDPNRMHDKILDASPEFVRNVNTLVAMKNRWVELMQASATEDGVPAAEQRACWDECMRQAEEIIANERAEAH